MLCLIIQTEVNKAHSKFWLQKNTPKFHSKKTTPKFHSKKTLQKPLHSMAPLQSFTPLQVLAYARVNTAITKRTADSG